MAIIPTTKLFKDGHILICNTSDIQIYLDKGYRFNETPEATNRQSLVNVAIKKILDKGDPDDLTSGGLPRLGTIAKEAGLEAVYAKERSLGMEQ